MTHRRHDWFRTAGAICALGLLSACSALDRLSEVGQPPQFEPVINPTQRPDYAPVSMPMPAADAPPRQANSLWRPGARAFFKDQRAVRIGDIMTVEIAINDNASISNETRRTRDNAESASINNLFGYEASLSRLLPEAIDNVNLLDLESDLRNAGAGEISRDEQVDLKIAAVVTQLLPNGNMVIEGNQEVRVNYELRALHIRGIVRPEDITASNTVSYEKIAEARIDYGGRGQIFDVQQPRYGSQVLDIVNPF